ncbi:MAG: hypothetical protein ACPIOQ_44730 [Promethearchaeia archaeon]
MDFGAMGDDGGLEETSPAEKFLHQLSMRAYPVPRRSCAGRMHAVHSRPRGLRCVHCARRVRDSEGLNCAVCQGAVDGDGSPVSNLLHSGVHDQRLVRCR